MQQYDSNDLKTAQALGSLTAEVANLGKNLQLTHTLLQATALRVDALQAKFDETMASIHSDLHRESDALGRHLIESRNHWQRVDERLDGIDTRTENVEKEVERRIPIRALSASWHVVLGLFATIACAEALVVIVEMAHALH